ncbi:dephospho-CoA kinase [Thermosinus carboxydivorans Nor1]|uniref:Dephospho-CoA kinase n=1 Tax=Thermosinus carboxydivorans Nor1 TaxID=401526 RepID=A1HPM5_9FIRM|nr:dephospho-CoA kinase [Thermosinus carboxydivorans]EAX47995.1 dephospho-CoA kinase [Thermosinus carboxydivorans Nor1]
MYVIGLTGGIGSGKSTVSAMLQELGAVIIDADEIAREVVATGKPAWREIKDEFGLGVLNGNGSINRKALGEIVFSDAKQRAKLEAITHPRIQAAVETALKAARKAGVRVVVLDVPLLIEKGWDHLADAVWVVYVDERTQLERLMARDRLTEDEARARISAQMSLREKAERAHVVIDNSGSIDATRRQVLIAWQKIPAEQ